MRPYMEERPPFGPDRLEADRVRPGVKVVVHHTGIGLDVPLTIVGMPYRDDGEFLAGTWWVDCESRDGTVKPWSLSDIGVIPTRSGLWNPGNWAEVTA